ncbi:MAG: endolytic transglycosylase MltG [Sphingobacteriales bacterium]|nr:MAG: endolytic transglycosylase MltG [Sphingobacteriales bacterium]
MGARAKKTSGGKRIAIYIVIIVLLLAAAGAFMVFGPNTGTITQTRYLYIRTGSTYDDVKSQLKENGYIASLFSFDMLAQRAGYPTRIKAGKYKITPGMSNYNMVRMLRSGRQTPVKLVINKLRTKQDLVNIISTNLEADSSQLKQILADNTYWATYNLDTNTAMCLIVPDTYEFYWNTSADKTLKKLGNYYKEYWTPERHQKAEAHKLTQQQAIVVGSIVEEETNKNDEKGNVASVYINRLRKNMKLQADPTVKFAVGDFTLRRITGVHLQTESPYNTYKVSGLPPGPICTPSKKTMEAVLNSPETQYMYFCAKEDFSGYHRFATNYADHMKNARLYQQALNARNIH